MWQKNELLWPHSFPLCLTCPCRGLPMGQDTALRQLHAHACARTRVNMHTHMNTRVCVHTYTRVHLHMHACTHMNIHMHIYVYTHIGTRACTQVPDAHTRAHTCTGTCIYTRAHRHTCACTHVRTRVHMHAHTCTHMYAHICMHTRVCTRAHTHMLRLHADTTGQKEGPPWGTQERAWPP